MADRGGRDQVNMDCCRFPCPQSNTGEPWNLEQNGQSSFEPLDDHSRREAADSTALAAQVRLICIARSQGAIGEVHFNRAPYRCQKTLEPKYAFESFGSVTEQFFIATAQRTNTPLPQKIRKSRTDVSRYRNLTGLTIMLIGVRPCQNRVKTLCIGVAGVSFERKADSPHRSVENKRLVGRGSDAPKGAKSVPGGLSAFANS